MWINFAIVTVLHAEADVKSPALELIFLKVNILSRHLEDVQQIIWYIFVRYRFIHDVS